jgi:26S proteasome non-ATPase regulatory subunit 9
MGEHGAGGRLVDSEGFPRADIDVHSARVIRHDLVCAQNDYSALCKKLETALLEMHAQAKAEYDAAHPVPSAP